MDDRQRQLQAIKRKRLERKKRRRKVMFRRLIILMSFLAIIALIILSVTVFFPIKNINVVNPEPYTAEQIIEKSGITKGQNLWMAGNKANENITAAFPYISKITVKRKLPGTIVLDAVRAEVSVCYQTKNGFYLCDENNKLLEIKTEAPTDVTLVVGCDIDKTNPGKFLVIKNIENYELLEKLKKSFSENDIEVSEVDVSDVVNITFKVEKRFTVILGSTANLSAKITHLKEMIKNIDEKLVGEINLSYWTVESPRGIFTQKGSK